MILNYKNRTYYSVPFSKIPIRSAFKYAKIEGNKVYECKKLSHFTFRLLSEGGIKITYYQPWGEDWICFITAQTYKRVGL